MAGEAQWSSAGYWVCSHNGCHRKVRDHVTDHPCCGGTRHDTEHGYAQRRRADREAGITCTEPSTREEAIWLAVVAGAILVGARIADVLFGGGRR